MSAYRSSQNMGQNVKQCATIAPHKTNASSLTWLSNRKDFLPNFMFWCLILFGLHKQNVLEEEEEDGKKKHLNKSNCTVQQHWGKRLIQWLNLNLLPFMDSKICSQCKNHHSFIF